MQPVGKLGLRLSVIVTTYNNPRALSLVIAGLLRQTVREFELVIADDGSGPETAALIRELAAQAPFPIRHVWHPDQGFRKCTISNAAVRVRLGRRRFRPSLAGGGHHAALVALHGACVSPRACTALRGSVGLGAKPGNLRRQSRCSHELHAVRPRTGGTHSRWQNMLISPARAMSSRRGSSVCLHARKQQPIAFV